MINEFLDLVDSSILAALVETLLHSLWQASIIALILHFVLQRITDNKASLRYKISIAALFSCLALSVATFSWVYFADAAAPLIAIDTDVLAVSNSSISSDNGMHSIYGYLLPYQDMILIVWLVGVFLFSFKLMFSYIYIQWISRDSRLKANVKLTNILNKTNASLAIKKQIKIYESDYVKGPLMLGVLKPIILFPVGLLNQLTTAEVESILAHEVAHVMRSDFLINIMQSIVEVLFYYHPAVWWISANVRAEREYACDQLVVAHSDRPVDYAKLLVRLQEYSNHNNNQLTLAFAGDNKNFSNRIKRILNMSNNRLFIKEKVLALTFIGLSVFIFSFSNAAYDYNSIDLDEPIVELPSPVLLPILPVALDTLPEVKTQEKKIKKIISIDDSSDIMIIKKEISGSDEEDQDIELEMENGEVSSMIVNGKKVDPADYDQYMEKFDVDTNMNTDVDGNKTITKTYTFDSDSDEMDESHEKSIRVKTLRLGEKVNQRELKKMLEILEKQVDLADLQDLKALKALENLDGIESLEALKSLESLKALDALKGLEGLEGLDALDGESIRIKMLDGDGNMIFMDEDMDIDFDSFDFDTMGENPTIIMKRFEEGNDEHFQFPNGDNEFRFESFGSGKSISDKIAYKLNKDGLLEVDQSNKIELSGKHLKINGDKQPKNIFSKYKRYYEEIMGMELTKGSKIEFEAKGKSQAIRSF